MSQTLNDKLDGAVELGLLKKDIPDYVTGNLEATIDLRPYQVTALERWLYYIEDFPQRPTNPHLLFHMATGSGKTVLMAALILDLYRRGYRNFLFFVNSAQIIEKTKENFLNPASAKHLFAPTVRIDDKPVEIRAVETFDAVNMDVINIHFTTIQGLHTRMQAPKENSVTIEDFRDYKVVMISDEAHHLNAETKKTLTKGEAQDKASWESTVSEIFHQHPENMLLEFTATVDLNNEAIRAKYHDKILFDYTLRQFREDGYSKDIELRQADLPPEARMMQAMVLSQYRRKVAEAYGLHCKPVILMKSKTIKDSADNEAAFTSMVAGLTGEALDTLRTDSEGDETLSRAFGFIMDERAMRGADFARELRGDFAPEKVVNVNNPKDLENRQIELNALEDRDNEIRVIFAVDKLNEGWDVLNLFDIVRLYDTRDGKANKVGKTTMAEAQLIGRGARYFPFTAPDQADAAREKRKYDSTMEHPLRILEELHYHCSHNPKYIQDIRNALRETGMLDETTQTVQLRLKDSFKQSTLYMSEHVWVNDRIRNPREDVAGLDAYKIQATFTYPRLMTGRVTEGSAFGGGQSTMKQPSKEPVSRDFKLADFGKAIISFAMDANDFFHFSNLQAYFPKLASASEFITSDTYLGGVTVVVCGLPDDLDNLASRQKLDIAQYVLHQIESGVKHESIEYVGTREFRPQKISECFTDKTLKLRAEGETGLSWVKGETNVPGLDQIDLAAKDWYVYDDSYGTDQEKYFIKYLHDHSDRLRALYEDFHLLRNEKAVKLFDFETGQVFEPDFLLFLRRTEGGSENIMQLFIEPKGSHLTAQDKWKEDFLKQLKNEAKMHVFFQGKDYRILGLPFFNNSSPKIEEFKADFSSITSIDR
ncbi:DEAD/DEAH box helicase family protein [Vreelandella gomseomensis]|uniref:DEAD/DEAH box helicase family protein n=1 Tax=Vreelandella gomseomensis TaxID=370766 RepID=A0ABU1GCB0_9GAMM|nr:DEAD/DEAH box helicase family protein [Halomonas gomseomensis]MDR5875124.1 DEAD/DEAH box helicase family protein [Halomonas gomseomensis]